MGRRENQLNRAFGKISKTLLFAFLGAGLCSCAFMNPEKRPLLGAMDGALQPDNPWAMMGLMPVMMPVGLVAGTLDAIIVYPVTQIPPTASSINDEYFHKPDEGIAMKSLLFVPRGLVAIPDFLGVWTVRSFIQLPKRRRPAQKPIIDTHTDTEGMDIKVFRDGAPPPPEQEPKQP